jgi:hypothetical protein
MTYYKTFKRSCTNFTQFANARKITEEIGLTYEQALLMTSTITVRLRKYARALN